jgi:glyoxylase-like metal-dependent hydrolase (beta-lactamase superfamily II)
MSPLPIQELGGNGELPSEEAQLAHLPVELGLHPRQEVLVVGLHQRVDVLGLAGHTPGSLALKAGIIRPKAGSIRPKAI